MDEIQRRELFLRRLGELCTEFDIEFESGILKVHFPDDRDPAFVDLTTTRDDDGVITVTTY